MNFELLKEKAKALGIVEIEAYTSKVNGTELSLFDGEVDGNKTEISDVICVRGVYNNQMALVYTENNTDDAIDYVLNSIIDNASFMTKEEPYFIYEGDKEYPTAPVKETDFEEASIADKLQLCQKLNELLHKCEYAYTVEVQYGEQKTNVSIQNTKGLNVTRENKSAYLVGSFAAKSGDETKTSFEFVNVYKMADVNLEELANKIIDKAVSQFNGKPVASGNYDVVFDKKVVRSLLSAYSVLFSGEMVIKKMSFLRDKVNAKIFGENVTIIDEPLNPLAENNPTFDDEGVATKTTTLVENGVLKSFLHNLSTASMMGVSSTGNGFKAGVSGSVNVSPSNIYLKPGDKSLDELLALVNDGVYITSVTGLHAGVNVINGNYSLQASGYKIVDGKKADPVTLIIVSSSLTDTLNSITAIGNDLEFNGTTGAPSIALKNISISGK